MKKENHTPIIILTVVVNKKCTGGIAGSKGESRDIARTLSINDGCRVYGRERVLT